MEGEGNRLEVVTVENTRNTICEKIRKDLYVEYKIEELQAWELVERTVFLVILAVLLYDKKMDITTHGSSPKSHFS